MVWNLKIINFFECATVWNLKILKSFGCAIVLNLKILKFFECAIDLNLKILKFFECAIVWNLKIMNFFEYAIVWNLKILKILSQSDFLYFLRRIPDYLPLSKSNFEFHNNISESPIFQQHIKQTKQFIKLSLTQHKLLMGPPVGL